MVTPLCPLCTVVSEVNSLIARTLSQTKHCVDVLHTTEVMAIFCDFLAYFGQNLVAVATSLRPLQSEMFSLDWTTTNTPVISNHILAISRTNAIICIYSNISPKIGCHGNAPLSLV